MKVQSGASRKSQSGAAIVETLVVVGIIGTLFLSLYGGITSGFAVVNLARENLRANQIALEKMETIRLYTWDQINSNGFIAATFTAPFFPEIDLNSGTTSSRYSYDNTDAAANVDQETAAKLHDGGFTYYGSIYVTNVTDVPSEYSDTMKKVIVSVTWTNGGLARSRQMETLVSEYGMQNYIY